MAYNILSTFKGKKLWAIRETDV